MPSFLKSLTLLAIAATFLLGFAPLQTQAQTQLYWDTNGTSVYSGNTGGIWGTNNFWSTSANGLSATSAYTAGSLVTFSAGTDGTGTYTITLAPGVSPAVGNQSAAGLGFQEGHITIAPTTTTPTGSVETLTLTGTAPTLNVQNMDSTITARVNSSGLTKTGVGKITLDFGALTGTYFALGGSNTPVTINRGTLELKGTAGGDQLSAAGGIIVNSGGTFLWGGVNNIANSTLFTINTGGSIINKTATDQVGYFRGNGLLTMTGGAMTMNIAANDTFSGIINGTGTLQANSGNGHLTLTNANTFSGSIGGVAANVNTGSIRLGHIRSAQNATLNLINYDVNAKNVSFASGIGTFITGGLQGTSNLSLQDADGNAITLQTGNRDANTTYRGAISGSGGLTKIGMGTLTLTGEQITVTRSGTLGAATYISNTSNTYTGDTTILAGAHNPTSGSVTQLNAGGIRLDFNTTVITPVTNSGTTYTYTINSPTSNIISASSRLVLGGGKLTVAGNNGGIAVSQTFNNTRLLTGRSYVTVARGTTPGDTVVNLGNIDRSNSPGSLVEFTLPTGTQSLTNGITTTTANDASGILGGWAIVGNDWAVKNTSGNAIGNVVAASAGVYTTYTNSDISSAAASNLLIDNSAANITTATGVTDLNTIMVRNDASNGNAALNRTIDIAAGETLRLGASGSIWNQGSQVTASVPSLSIGTANNVGTLTAGGADNTAGELIINNSGGGEILVRSSITDNGTGAVTLIRTGAGNQVVFSGTNTHTGGTIITQGRNRFDNVGGLGSGPVTVTAGGQLWLNAGGTYAQTFNLSGTGYGEGGIPGALRLVGNQTFTGQFNLTGDTRLGAVNATSAVTTIAGKITGDYALDLSGGAGGANIIQVNNSTNDFTGNFSINTNFTVAPTAYNSANVTVRLGASEVLPNGLGKGNVILSGSSSTTPVTLDLNGFNETINSLISYGTHANTAITNSKVGTTSTLTIGDNNSSTLVTETAAVSTFFGGIIKDTGTGLVALTKIGEGTQTLTGANTYSGATNINKGILQAGAANTLSANSDVTIANDATAMLSLTDSIADYSQTIKSLSGFGTVNLGTIAAANAITLTTGSTANTTYAGTIVGAGGLAKQGISRFTITGNNTYVGNTTVNEGNLQVGELGLGQSGSGATTIANNATLSGTGTVRGATTILGTLKAGDNGGDSIGKLTFSDLTASALTLTGGGTVATPRALFTLAGATGNEANPMDGIQTASFLNGTFGNHDALEIQGTLNLTSGSVIKVEFATGYTPQWGDVFNLIDWGTINGGASAINPGTFNTATDLSLALNSTMTTNGWFWNTDQFLSHGIVYVVPEPNRALLILLGLSLTLTLGIRRRR